MNRRLVESLYKSQQFQGLQAIADDTVASVAKAEATRRTEWDFVSESLVNAGRIDGIRMLLNNIGRVANESPNGKSL
jgi:hypothetical protein